MREPSENMRKMYASKREATLARIQEAIDAIQEDHRIVTKKELMALTGLSSGTFSQEHVKELLAKNQVCQYRPTRKVSAVDRRELNKDDEIARLGKELQRAQSRLQDLDIALDKSNKRLQELKAEKEELEQQHLLLRGKYQQLMEILEVLGCDLSEIPLA